MHFNMTCFTRLLELCELLKEKKSTELSDEELQGRQSGSAPWRQARGEMGGGQASKVH